MDRSRVAIVIPAFNEEQTIEKVILSVMPWGIPIVVDDGSTDQTAVLAQKAGAIVIRHDINRGYDASLNTGFAKAKSEGFQFVLTIDADGQHDATSIKQFIEALESGADVVAGVRDRRQRIAEHLFAWVTTILWGMKDPLCGMKAYRMSVYDEIGHFDCYESIGSELLLFAARTRRRIAEIPIHTERRKDPPRFGKTCTANYRIIKALYRSLINRHHEPLSQNATK